MSPRRTHHFELELNEINLSLFPEGIGKEKEEFYDAVKRRLRAAFDLVNETVTLTPENRSAETFALIGDRSGLEQWLGEA